MSREVLQELVRDVRRLLTAGTAGAVDDAGLRRREQGVSALAAKVHALAPVAGAVTRVLRASPSAAAPALCELLHLTRQLQAGLASAGCDGKAVAVEKSGSWQTAAAVRDVSAWAAASFHPDSNDLRAMRGAVKRPDFADLRLVQPLFKKLTLPDSGEGEDVLADGALAAFGASLLPDLRNGLDLKGGVADARRLRALCALVPKEGIALCRQALAEGSATMKTQAIRLLTRLAPAEAERAALEVIGSKARGELREAAFRALTGSRDDRALEALVIALRDDDNLWGTPVYVLARQQHPRATARLLELLGELRTAEAEAAARPKKGAQKGKAGPDAEALREAIHRAARVLGERKDAAAVPALVEMLGHKHVDVREFAIEAMCEIGDPKGLRAAADLMGDAKVWEWAGRAAWLLPEPERYERLAPLVEELSRPKKSEHRRGKFVLDLFEEEFEDPDAEINYDDEFTMLLAPKTPRSDWHRRWVPLLRKHLNGPYRPDAALGLAAVLGEKAIPELLALLVPSVKKNECGVAEALGHLKAREAVPAMVGLMPGQPSHHACIHDALRLINDPSAAPLLEALLHKTKDAYRRAHITAVIEYLERHKAEM